MEKEVKKRTNEEKRVEVCEVEERGLRWRSEVEVEVEERGRGQRMRKGLLGVAFCGRSTHSRSSAVIEEALIAEALL